MKISKFLIVFLLGIILQSCKCSYESTPIDNNKDSIPTNIINLNNNDVICEIVNIDSCEYLQFTSRSRCDILVYTHKGNCKYCQARHNQGECK